MTETTPARYEVLDDRFLPCTRGDRMLHKLWTGGRWCEGAAYFPAGKYVVWSDIPNNRMLRWDETTGSVGVFRKPAGHSNGNTMDREGRLVTCEHYNRRVTRTEHDGSITVIADQWNGMKFNSPNDVVVKSDGSIWFTDPAYGCDIDYEGHGEPSEIGECNVYRVDPDRGEVTMVANGFERPNGLAFSLDESMLYVADTPGGHIKVFEVTANGTALSGGEIFTDAVTGVFDGFRLDHTGRIWAGVGDGVSCYDPDGTLIGKVLVPEVVANVTFGGPKNSDLFICGTSSLYLIRLSVNGARRPQ
ncbi:SMP-30/gluconolactonase/LRE family protein [Flindersiella endophytica]